jgi:hypothetical protein
MWSIVFRLLHEMSHAVDNDPADPEKIPIERENKVREELGWPKDKMRTGHTHTGMPGTDLSGPGQKAK